MLPTCRHQKILNNLQLFFATGLKVAGEQNIPKIVVLRKVSSPVMLFMLAAQQTDCAPQRRLVSTSVTLCQLMDNFWTFRGITN